MIEGAEYSYTYQMGLTQAEAKKEARRILIDQLAAKGLRPGNIKYKQWAVNVGVVYYYCTASTKGVRG